MEMAGAAEAGSLLEIAIDRGLLKMAGTGGPLKMAGVSEAGCLLKMA